MSPFRVIIYVPALFELVECTANEPPPTATEFYVRVTNEGKELAPTEPE